MTAACCIEECRTFSSKSQEPFERCVWHTCKSLILKPFLVLKNPPALFLKSVLSESPEIYKKPDAPLLAKAQKPPDEDCQCARPCIWEIRAVEKVRKDDWTKLLMNSRLIYIDNCIYIYNIYSVQEALDEKSSPKMVRICTNNIQ